MAVFVDVHLVISQCFIMSELPVVVVVLAICFIWIYEHKVVMKSKAHSIQMS